MTSTIPAFLLVAARIPAVAIGLPLGLGFLSGYPTAQVVRSDWYKNLRKPPGQPPRQVFPIVWPLLYASMGYASHLIVAALDRGDLRAELALKLYYAQLGLNLAWSPLFFGFKRPGLALVDIAALAGTTFYLTKILGPISATAAYLLLPYCAWLSFATYLNVGIWWMEAKNKDKKRVVCAGVVRRNS
ncbi:TspO/MBR-related protein [Mycena chlorophos]|uniref:TspO/MBR-related protein n=1 Tax=Mycena chlorophos TaxID=658473 RepID=A0A8H6S380_MYCCL|nr:TspO/MBR-related protein [Mycena chlorophos]